MKQVGVSSQRLDKIRKLTALFWVRDSYLPTIKAAPLHKAVLLLSASYANPDGSRIFQSSRGVATLLGCERSTVQDAFKFWRERGVLLLVRAGNGRKHANEYRLNLNIDLETNGVPETPFEYVNGVTGTPFNEGNGVIEADKRGGKRGDKRGAGNPPPNHRSHREETGEERSTRIQAKESVLEENQKTPITDRRVEVIARFGDDVYLAIVLQEQILGVQLSDLQIEKALERLTQLKACGETPATAVPEVVRQVTAAHAPEGRINNGRTLGEVKGSRTPVEHLELGSEGFRAFCAAYPSAKLDRKETLRQWCKGACERDVAEILGGLGSWKLDEQWRKQNGRFIPWASSFLERQRWKNAPQQSAPGPEFPRFEVEEWAR